LEHPLRIAITLGDPGGIGPEVALKALRHSDASAAFFVFGSKSVLQTTAAKLGLPPLSDSIQLIEIDNVLQPYFGESPEIGGKASIEYLEHAFEFYRAGKIDAIVTGPIHKEAWHRAGYLYAGQTEYCAEKTDATQFCMLMASERFRIALLSTHLSLHDALQKVQRGTIIEKVRLLDREFRALGFSNPKIGCAALNPHAGEAGAFGFEEQNIIQPALEELRAEGITVEGPIAPEVIFRRAASEKIWDVILAMYHDQAMIPLKLIDFDRSANVTLGLPLIRTSPDHGTAFDIAGKGIANPGSMRYAIDLAIDWTGRKIHHGGHGA
jgi:4-phospho-D-threonate 3-dehydrogenase / 4-phospho-D-erythronate 3-dehydrogenase